MSRGSPERAFGATIFGGLAAIQLLRRVKGRDLSPTLIGLALLALTLAIFLPRFLAPLRRAWISFGNGLGRVVNPVFLAVVYYFVVTPVAWIRRISSGSDPLNLKLDPDTPSYWKPRLSPQPVLESLRRQY